MADLTPADKDLLLAMTDVIADYLNDWMQREEAVARVRAELIAHGFRAPGPQTEEEVERAARVKAGPGSRWEALPSVVRGLFLAQAREELTAALRVGKGKSDDNA